MAVACEGSDGVGVANIGEPSDSDPDDAGVEVSVSSAERVTTVAASLTRPQFVIPGALLFGVYPG